MPYFNRRNELSLQQKCVMWGMRVVVPKTLQRGVLHELHEGHQGIARVKELARSYV